MKIILSNKCEVEKAEIKILYNLMAELSMINPKFIEAQKQNRYTGNISPQLHFYELEENFIVIPRGALNLAINLYERNNLSVQIIDKTIEKPSHSFTFKGKLRDYQELAVRDILSSSQGVLEAGTGAGKTVIALDVISRRKQPSLILVHSRQLLSQWMDKIREFLNIEPGQLGAGRKTLQPVTVGTFQTVGKMLDITNQFGQVIVDEAHRVPAPNFMKCLYAFPCKYLLGLTATPFRNDGLTSLIHYALGELVHKVNNEHLRENGNILKPEVVLRETDFQFNYQDNYPIMLKAVVSDTDRNKLIAQDISRETEGVNLICSDRIEQLNTLSSLIQGGEVLTGKTPNRQRERIKEYLKQGKIKNLFSTFQFIGEGFDYAGFSNLFLASPMKFKGRVIQIVGRILRPKEGKTAKIYDYVDIKQPVLNYQALERQNTYQQLI